jgi:hypothetical protein
LKLVYEGEFLYKQFEMKEPTLYLTEPSHILINDEAMDYRERLPEWSLIGLREFFVDSRPLFDTVATKVAQVDFVEKTKFTAVLKRYPKLY